MLGGREAGTELSAFPFYHLLTDWHFRSQEYLADLYSHPERMESDSLYIIVQCSPMKRVQYGIIPITPSPPSNNFYFGKGGFFPAWASELTWACLLLTLTLNLPQCGVMSGKFPFLISMAGSSEGVNFYPDHGSKGPDVQALFMNKYL